ncbi:uncharacterized protein [Leptinotarsa decemlineata]|uniref:uncharacterized protein n=1 Tax=Leptinotarsa decemlineata TaxID=7539 RepID=UPI000C2545F7|nr:uncharacterized protein LOC111506477 [Leptinotarsa decemlineata]
MWLFFGVCACFFGGGLSLASSNYFCADMNPQHHVIIDQLMGMWFGIEKIDHLDETRYIDKKKPSCPIIHISEDRRSSTTLNPLYKNYNYGYNYGEGHGYNTQRPINARERMLQLEMRKRIYEQSEYDRQTTYGDYPASRRQHNYNDILGRQNFAVKYLRLYWDENGESTEFHMRYNVSRAGFWISSGPENGGSSLDPEFSHFAGTIQVLKAVGNHLVLTFCHQLPDRQLYSILLSRELKLDHVEIHGVHNMLQRKGLRTNSVQKLCNSGKKHSLSNILKGSTLMIFFVSRLLKN